MVSIVIPVYNCREYIAGCIESALSQTYRDIEVIVVDDGSTDGTGAICGLYGGRDERVKVIRRENGGVNRARQDGVAAARGDYLMFADADDYLDTRIVGRCVRLSRKRGADIVCFNYECGGKKGFAIQREKALTYQEAAGQILKKKLLDGNLWCKLYARRLFEGIEFPVRERNMDDFLIVDRVMGRAGRIVVLPDIGYHYRVVEGSMSHRSFYRGMLTYCESTRRYSRNIGLRFPELRDAADSFYLQAVLFVMGKMEKDISYCRREPDYRTLRAELIRLRHTALCSSHITGKDRLMYCLAALKCYRGAYLMYTGVRGFFHSVISLYAKTLRRNGGN